MCAGLDGSRLQADILGPTAPGFTPGQKLNGCEFKPFQSRSSSVIKARLVSVIYKSLNVASFRMSTDILWLD